MSGSWKQYEGHVINNIYPLLQYLGGSEQSAVFLTELSGPQSTKAAIKLIPEGDLGDLHLSLWRRATKVMHPNVLRLYQGGRCRLAGMDLLYVVMEYSEEDLSQILPQRALTAPEARDMLGPVLNALVALHGQGLVHSHLKPSNILATRDQVKLSSDTLFPVGDYRKSFRKRDIYDAPESVNQPLTPACDVWSLGMMLVEVLTQHAPEWSPTGQAESLVPETLPQPFLDIAGHALQRDTKLRWTLGEIGASLNPRAAAAAAQGISPLNVPLSPVAAVPAARLEAPKPARPVVKAPPPQPEAARAPGQTLVLPNYVVPLAGAIVVLAAIITLPKILGKRPETSTSASTATKTPAAQPVETPARPQPSRSTKPSPAPANTDSPKTTVAVKPAAKEVPQAAPAAPSPAVLRTETKTTADVPKDVAKSSVAGSPRGEVLDQVLPDASEKALATIQGKVRVGVLVHVDAAGNVASAELANAGPSQYFADLALKAARRWEFTSPEADGHSVPSEWQIRFEFTSSGVKAFPSQTTP